MNTLLCSKNSFHVFAEHQGWLLLFDKVNDDKSEVGYLLQNGSSVLAAFIDGEFDNMNDITLANISVNDEKKDDDD